MSFISQVSANNGVFNLPKNCRYQEFNLSAKAVDAVDLPLSLNDSSRVVGIHVIANNTAGTPVIVLTYKILTTGLSLIYSAPALTSPVLQGASVNYFIEPEQFDLNNNGNAYPSIYRLGLFIDTSSNFTGTAKIRLFILD